MYCTAYANSPRGLEWVLFVCIPDRKDVGFETCWPWCFMFPDPLLDRMVVLKKFFSSFGLCWLFLGGGGRRPQDSMFSIGFFSPKGRLYSRTADTLQESDVPSCRLRGQCHESFLSPFLWKKDFKFLHPIFWRHVRVLLVKVSFIFYLLSK